MNQTWKGRMKTKLLVSIVLFALGLLLLIAPGEMLTAYVRAIGVLLLLGAAAGFFLYFRASAGERSVLLLIGASLGAACGLVLIAAPGLITSVLPFVFGLLLLIASVSDLLSALALPFGKLPGILLSIGGIVLGVLIVSNPDALANFITRLVGLGLMYEAAVGVVTVILAKKSFR